VGISDLWMLGSGERPFLFVGAVVAAEYAQSWRNRLQTWIDRLVHATHLKGLNCMDFMIDRHGVLHVLEINARPSATMALYDPDFRRGLLASHILAAQHGYLDEAPATGMARAFRVMFAKHRTPVTHRTDWPAWVADRPPAGTVVEAGQPLCTIQAESRSRNAVLTLIKQRSARLQDIVLGAAANVPSPPHH
jgi:predicted ATP-grasp superfamily ATP-dependent carboligase